MAEPGPDIYELFCYYNSLYFRDALGACIVSWDPCLTSMATSCDCMEDGLCEIRLSVPFLKSCSSAVLKNILLHEMIHAFLWITNKNNNHSDHGCTFWNLANLINSNRKEDDQRPCNGYNITARHGFQNEEDTCCPRIWMCGSCGDLMERWTGREPSPSDCIEKDGVDNDCGKLSCGWHMHKKLCPGRYVKVDDVSKFENRGKFIDVEENDDDKPEDISKLSKQARQRRLPAEEEIKEKRVIKKPRFMAEYLSTVDLRTRSLAIGPEIPRQRRTSCRKICDVSNTDERTYHKRGREITLVIQLFGVYTDEESEEDLEPLINKRSERRKRMKLFNNSDGRCEPATTGLTTHEVISLD